MGIPGDVTPSRVFRITLATMSSIPMRREAGRIEPKCRRHPLARSCRVASCRYKSGFTTAGIPSRRGRWPLGESLPVIAKLLGHSQIRTTARYAHLARDSVRASAARVAASIAEDFLKGGSATAKLPGRKGTDSPG